jgi:LysR family hydrogen peroxide-inducible transcriptional activator
LYLNKRVDAEDMTITQLEYFLAVVNHGSFSTAAEHSFVTQPTLSMQIGSLEDELGVILLNRSSKPIVPTEAGKAVLEQARKAVAAFRGTKEKVNEIKGGIDGRLRLGVIPTISPYLIPGFIPEFLKRYPKVKLEIRDMFTADIVDALNRDAIDVAILSGGIDMKIRETPLFNDKLFVYVSPKNKLYKQTSVLISEINVRELLILSEGNCLRNQVLTLCKAHKKLKPAYTFANCSLETLMHTVDCSAGVTIIPGMAIEYIREDKRGQIKPFGEVDAHRKITMAASRTYAKDALVEAVRESVLAVAGRYDMLNMLYS